MPAYSSERTKKLALSAIFASLAFLVTLVPAPKVSFLSFDIKDTVIALASLILGPSTAVALSIIVPLLESISVGTTGPWGLLMDVISTMSFSLTVSLIYKFRKTLGGAVLSLCSAVAVQVSMMMLANIFITPLYTGAPRSVVIGMLLPLLLPFNAVKSVFNAALVMLLYKPTIESLRRARILRSPAPKAVEAGKGYRLCGRSMFVFCVSLIVTVAAALLLFLVLGAAWEGAA